MKFQQTALTSIDSYKLGHAGQYPEGTTKVYSNFTARSSKNFKARADHIIVVWSTSVPWRNEYIRMKHSSASLLRRSFLSLQNSSPPFAANGLVRVISSACISGYLPLDGKSIQEGSLVNIGVPVLTVTNTVPDAYWLPNFLETWMSSELWKASTSATISLPTVS